MMHQLKFPFALAVGLFSTAVFAQEARMAQETIGVTCEATTILHSDKSPPRLKVSKLFSELSKKPLILELNGFELVLEDVFSEPRYTINMKRAGHTVGQLMNYGKFGELKRRQFTERLLNFTYTPGESGGFSGADGDVFSIHFFCQTELLFEAKKEN